MSEGFTINKAYAERYNKWRKKEELQKLKDKYGDVEDDEGSSSSESEEEGTEALTDKFDREWMKTLAALKSKDPKIYQKDVKFFHGDSEKSSSDENEEEQKRKKKKKEKPMYLKDYHRKLILEKGGIVSDDDEKELPTTGPGYYEEQEDIKKSIAAAVGSSDDDSDDEGLLTRREKTKEEKDMEEQDFLTWMKGHKKSVDADNEVGRELEPLKNYWDNPDLDAGEKYLKNYILNKKYMEEDEDESIPTYDELVNDEEELSSEEEFIQKQESFEKKYNFRFEEPEGAEIKSFPRNIEDSLRRKDTKRAEKRKEVKERKDREKEKKREELKQLKNLKRQEILDKIDKLKQITGNEKLGFDEKDLEDDFDPKKHDEMMQKYFDEGYYAEGEEEMVKPVFDEDYGEEDYQDADWDGWTGEPTPSTSTDQWEGMDIEDPNFVMDADYDPAAAAERKSKKKRSKLAQALAAQKPVFDPNEKTFEEYFDEYYKLDYEDIIDDMPCRFKYRKVPQNDFGLTADEVLKAKDKELNAWVSLKKMTQYRTTQEEEADIRVYSSKGKNIRKKQNILHSLFESEKEENETQSTKKNKSKKSNQNQNENSQGRQGKQSSWSVQSTEQSHGHKRQVDWQVSDVMIKKQRHGELEQVADSSEVKKKGKKERHDELEQVADSSEVKKTCKKERHTHLYSATSSSEDVASNRTSQDNSQNSEVKRKSKKHRHGDEDAVVDEGVLEVSKQDDVDMVSQTAETKVKKKKHKKKHQSLETDTVNNSMEASESATATGSAADGPVLTERMKKNKKKKDKKNKAEEKLKMSDERLKAYGINPKRYKYMKKEDLFQVKPRKDTQNDQVL